VRRAGAIAAVVAACVVAALALGANGGDGGAKTYEIVLDNAFGLTDGGDFKIAGVKVGKTGNMRLEGQAHPVAIVEAKVTEPGQADLRQDATCEVRPQSFIGEYFIDCQPGSSLRHLPDGGRVPLRQTSSTIGLDLVNNILRRPYRDRLRLIVGELGAGLAGRPQDLNAAIRRAHPGLRETSQTLRILGRQTKTIRSLIRDADRVVGQLEKRKTDVSRFVREAGRTAETASSERVALGESFQDLPAFLAELEPYATQLGDLAEAQQPVLRNLGAASGDLNTLLKRLRPFAQTGTPALQALGSAAVVGRRAIQASQAEIHELRLIGQDAPGLAKPLRQFLQTIDDRKRAVENDPRAVATGPPAPDKTHISGRGGFTGMEAIWNYFYWQALSTNALDNVGHVLRLNITTGCGTVSYINNPTADQIKCGNQFLGPTQPGVTTPDPTLNASASGTADAAPVAQAVAATASPPGDASTTRLLDYLLAP
jgi:phospholipid/cholesterol/gamma-HCH transport system substrate-binding protein